MKKYRRVEGAGGEETKHFLGVFCNKSSIGFRTVNMCILVISSQFIDCDSKNA